MTQRTWLPSDWMDEMPPTFGESPDSFLKRNTAGVLQLTPIGDLEPEDWPQPVDIEVGAEIAFTWVERHDSVAVIVEVDGTYSVRGTIAESANSFWDGNAIADSIGGLVAGDEFNDPLGPGEYDVSVSTWSDESVVFAVRVLESGAASFVEVPK